MKYDSIADPKAALINAFISLRMATRKAVQQRDIAAHSIHTLKRAARILQDKSPFNHHRVNQLLADADRARATLLECKDNLKSIGAVLIRVGATMSNTLSREDLYDVLNISPADRGEIEPTDGFIELVYARGLEDSASHRGEDWKNGPLFHAINAVIMDWILHDPEGQAAGRKLMDDAFAPGGLFHGVPTYHQQPDGSMARKAPDLVLHDANGQHVIARKPTIH